jgi:voltage-gated potassium channel
MLVISIGYLFLVVYEMLPGIRMNWALYAIDVGVWLVFLRDYVWRVYFLTPPGDRKSYRKELLCRIDLLVVLAFPAMLALTGLLALLSVAFPARWLGAGARVLRVVAQLVRFVRVFAVTTKTAAQTQRVFTRANVAVVAPLLLILAVLATAYAYRSEMLHDDPTITSPGRAAWWAIVTMFTVGYGDTSPHTAGGQIAAGFLMALGVALVGLCTAWLASTYVDNELGSVEKDVHLTLVKMADRLEAIEAHLGCSPPPADELEE